MSAFTIYCPTCNRHVLIKPALRGVRRRGQWQANCEHAKDAYIEQLKQQIKEIDAADWVIMLPYAHVDVTAQHG